MAAKRRATLSLERLVRPNILKLKPYRCARDDYSKGVLLDANECAYGSSLPMEGENHRYPCPYQLELKQKIAEFRSIKRDQIFLGVGSDEAIDMIMRVFCTPAQDSILITPPTYGMYKVVANINNLDVISVPLNEHFQLPVEKILEALTPATKVIYLCSPNNPTANNLATDDILALLNSSFEGIIVVDEAYVDFSETPSLCSLLKNHPRLIILQTMSKAFGFAGIRLGMAFAHEDIIETFNKVKFPYSVNKLTSKVALEAYSNTEGMKNNVRKILEEKQKVIAELQKLSFVKKIFPSDANFLLVKIEHAYKLYKTMADRGVVTRYRGDQVGCDSCIRITIGTPEENASLLDMIKKTFEEINNTNILHNGVQQ